jgi:Serine dehydrogenase proteinase
LLIVSNGGDPTVAWRIMSLLREKVDAVGVLVPQSAFSAATLIALGADEIVMHPCSNLGPVDPQITVQRLRPGTNEKELISFGSEDLAGFLRFIRESVGLSDQEYLKSAFELFCREAGAVPIGVATRAAQLSVSMGEKLLRMHMKDDVEGQKAKAIAETLNTKFFHYGYPVGRKEAKDIGLKVSAPAPELERLIWEVWLDLEAEMNCRVPFNPMDEISRSPLGSQLFANIPQVTIPSGFPPELMQMAAQQVLQQISVVQLPAVDFELRQAIIESPRKSSAYVTRGKIFARREMDLKISLNRVILSSRWVAV